MKLLNNYEIRIIPTEEGDYFAVRFPDFPGVVTGGSTPGKALKNAEEALEATLAVMKARRIPLPKPKSSFSGQFNVRVPRELHKRLVRGAEEEGVSLNAYINYILTTTQDGKKKRLKSA